MSGHHSQGQLGEINEIFKSPRFAVIKASKQENLLLLGGGGEGKGLHFCF